MDRNEFQSLLHILQETELEIDKTKGRKYSQGDTDALLNFKRAAEFLSITPLKVCLVYMYKHFAALASFAADGHVMSESIRGRVVDLRLYTALFYGLTIVEEPLRLEEEWTKSGRISEGGSDNGITKT